MSEPRSPAPTVWVTRTPPGLQPLCDRLEQAGYRAVAVPTLAIEGPADTAALAARARAELGAADGVIFVSRNAVDWLAYCLDGEMPSLLAHAAVIAVGPGTASALRERGIEGVIQPGSGADSEALLALPRLGATAVADSSIVIVRGRGGREFLADTLHRRGARVAYLEVYERRYNEQTAARLPGLWRAQPPVAIVVASPAGLEALLAMTAAGDRPSLLATPLLCLGRRLPAQARARGFQQCVPVPAAGGEAAVVRALEDHRAREANDGQQ